MESAAPKRVRYPVHVTKALSSPVVRRLVRGAAVTPALLVVLASPHALAAPPENWADPEPTSGLDALLLLAGAPLALMAIITLLVYIPSMARRQRYTPGLAWRNENEWFGGPVGGVDALDKAEEPPALEAGDAENTESRGGASARW